MRRCLFALLLSLCPVTHAAELGSPLVSVDERIELAAVVARLAGFEEQLSCQGLPRATSASRLRAFRITSIFRMTATSATLLALPLAFRPA